MSLARLLAATAGRNIIRAAIKVIHMIYCLLSQTTTGKALHITIVQIVYTIYSQETQKRVQKTAAAVLL